MIPTTGAACATPGFCQVGQARRMPEHRFKLSQPGPGRPAPISAVDLAARATYVTIPTGPARRDIMSNPWEEAEDARAVREPIFKLPGIILLLLAVMVGVQVLLTFFAARGDNGSVRFVDYAFGLVPGRYDHAHPQTLLELASLAWPFVTHGFVHGNWTHLLFNAVWLMAVGTPLARRLGTPAFLGFYFVSGALAAATHLVLNLHTANAGVPVVGASGAISGCMAAALRVMLSGSARYFLHRHPGMGSLAPIWDRRILVITVVFIGINALSGTSLLVLPGAEGAAIAWQAHVGGFIAGLLIIPLFDRLGGGATRAYPTL